MATVFDVVKYILNKYGEMSAMKLQKLVFYSQAMSLVWDDVPLFDEEFEAWAKGPVCRELFNAHKGKFMLHDSDFLKPYAPDISRLSDMVHQEKPWLDAHGNCPAGAHCSNVISKESMEEYYLEKW